MLLNLDGHSLNCQQLVQAATLKAKVAVNDVTWDRVRASRKVVEQWVARGLPAYGITTGVGSQKDFILDTDQLSKFNRQLVKAHATHATGPRLSAIRVRAILIILANGFTKGYSGVSEKLLTMLVERINSHEMPPVNAVGSVGASDLVPLSQLANYLFSQPSAQTFQVPGAKEALSMINSNAVTLAIGADVLINTQLLVDRTNLSLAMALEAFRCNLDMIDPSIDNTHSRKGQNTMSSDLRNHLHGSSLWHPGVSRKIQDPLSFRCAPQIHGTLQEMLQRALRIWDEELNAVTDNPIVDTHQQRIRSHGNMDTTRITLATDGLRQALAKTMDIAGERINKQQWSFFSDLPVGLAQSNGPAGGVQFLNLGHMAASFITSIKIWAHPSLLLSVGQLADGVEDTASHALHAVSDLERMVESAWRVIAIELIISVWAIHRRAIPLNQLGEGLRECSGQILDLLPLNEQGSDIFSIEPIVELLRSDSWGSTHQHV